MGERTRRQGYLRNSRLGYTDDDPLILQSAHRYEIAVVHAMRPARPKYLR
jgi:hypothetical protein